MKSEIDLNGYNETQIYNALAPENFHLILYPTEQCNFRCVYCYEDFEIGKMSNETVESVLKLIERKAQLGMKHLHISWFGGEPLLAKQIIKDICNRVTELSKEYDFYVDGNVTTNAFYLDTEILEFLSKHNQADFQISLDGTKDKHDKTRVTMAGGPTFDAIWARLIDAKNSDFDFKVMLRVHVTNENHESIEQLSLMIKNTFGSDPRFTTFYKGIFNAGGNQDELKKLVSKENENVSSEKNKDVVPDEKVICYAAKPNSIQIRADGSIGKCTVALQSPTNNIGKIKPDGRLSINQELFQKWVSGFESMDDWKLGCPWSFLSSQKQENLKENSIPIKNVSA